jgi:hypothetical protein
MNNGITKILRILLPVLFFLALVLLFFPSVEVLDPYTGQTAFLYRTGSDDIRIFNPGISWFFVGYEITLTLILSITGLIATLFPYHEKLKVHLGLTLTVALLAVINLLTFRMMANINLGQYPIRPSLATEFALYVFVACSATCIFLLLMKTAEGNN